MNRESVIFSSSLLATLGSAVAEQKVSVGAVERFSASDNYSGAMPEIFDEQRCDGVCFPTVSLEITDIKKTKPYFRFRDAEVN